MRLLAVLCLFGALLVGTGGLALGLDSALQAAHNNVTLSNQQRALQTLLLDGKTASAISSKKTAQEVKLLIEQQIFDHQQTVNSQKRLSVIVHGIETHLDHTIHVAVFNAAQHVAQEFRHK